MNVTNEISRKVVEAPDVVKALPESIILDCLNDVRPLFEKERALVELPDDDIVFVGDLHGDFETAKAIIRRFLGAKHVVFLGDYIDREPEKWGAVSTVMYLFLLKIEYPEKLILLKGNHEANYAIPCYPYEFERELRERFGSSFLHEHFVQVFSAMPMMMRSDRIFAAHGGIIKGATAESLRAIRKDDRCALEALVWSDPTVSLSFRGTGDSFDEEDLLAFLKCIDACVFMRAHDPSQLGVSLFQDSCLTILSSRQYSDMGNRGILAARAQGKVSRVHDVHVEDFSSGEWRTYQIQRR